VKKKEVIHPEKADKNFSTGAFSAAVEADGWLYVSGQAAVDFRTGKFRPGTIEEETRLTMHNIGQILKAAGCGFEDVVKCTVHLADIRDFDVYNQIYASYFDGVKPARTTVQSVLANNIKIEIDAIARIKTTSAK
jgi:2-iminobutanoate/2-iminopropanoate deaminase